jgi:hypothetical protein
LCYDLAEPILYYPRASSSLIAYYKPLRRKPRDFKTKSSGHRDKQWLKQECNRRNK